MKRISCIILLAFICLSLFTACSDKTDKEPDNSAEPNQSTIDKTGHPLFFKDMLKSDSVKATFVNSATDDREETEMELCEESDDYNTYTCYGDPERFNKVIFTYDKRESIEYAFNDYVSGWCNSAYGIIPYTEGMEISGSSIEYKTEMFDYGDYLKEVYIRTPKDYDPQSGEKYSVIYLLDGQNMLNNTATGTGCWNVAESVTSMMAQSDHKAIIVAIETPESTRYKELVPDIGDVQYDEQFYEDGEGVYFCDFVCNTVMPYVEKHYHVYTDPEHNMIAGASLGGAESFYIGMAHPEKFGAIGAFSPSFWLYDDATWEAFLSHQDYQKDAPLLYMYSGGEELSTNVHEMQKVLNRIGYPQDRSTLVIYPKGEHYLLYWRAIFPDFLRFAFA